MLQVIQLLKDGKAKEVSYNALASHIISEDGDNPEVGESREVFDLPVVKVNIQSIINIAFNTINIQIQNLMFTGLHAKKCFFVCVGKEEKT